MGKKEWFKWTEVETSGSTQKCVISTKTTEIFQEKERTFISFPPYLYSEK